MTKPYKTRAVALLKKVLKEDNGTIVSIKDIHNGYTNLSYLVTYANGKMYQVRFPHDEIKDLLNRKNEYSVMKLLGSDKYFPYFDPKTGVAVKQWIPGSYVKIHKWRKWKYTDELFSLIKTIHKAKVNLKKIPLHKVNFDSYNENLHLLKLEYQTKFLSIIDTYRDEVMVLNHTDINPLNIIMDKGKRLHLIDYEWCGLASDYWDYANFIRESRIRYDHIEWNKYIDNFNMLKLQDFIFACSVYAYLWTFVMPDSKKIRKYRKTTLRQVKWYGRKVINNGNK